MKKEVLGSSRKKRASLIPLGTKNRILDLLKSNSPEIVANKLTEFERYYDRLDKNRKHKRYPYWVVCPRCKKNVAIRTRSDYIKICKKCREISWIKNLKKIIK